MNLFAVLPLASHALCSSSSSSPATAQTLKMAGESSVAGSDVKAKAELRYRCYKMLEAVILTVVIVTVCGVFTVPTIFFALRPTVVSQS